MAESKKGSKLVCCDEDRIKLFIEHLGQDSNFKASLKQPVSVKDRKTSLQFLYVGEYLFDSGDYENLESVISEYTKSIVFAPPKSSELAQGYAGRSAVLFKLGMFSDCLLDIQRALENKYIDVMKPDLFIRRVQCLRILEANNTSQIDEVLDDTEKSLSKIDPEFYSRWEKMLIREEKLRPTENSIFSKWDNEKFIPKLESENPSIAGLSNAVDLKYSKKYGRHLVAKRKIKPGEVLMVHKPYAKVTLLRIRYKLCWNCGNQTWAGIPCDNCVNVIFCSEACREKGILEHHNIECPVIEQMIALDMKDGLFLCLRIVIKALKEVGGSFETLKQNLTELEAETRPLKKGFTNNIFDSTKFASVYSLKTQMTYSQEHEDLFITNSIVISYYLATKTEFFGKVLRGSLSSFKENKDFIFLVELITRVFEMTGRNAYHIAYRKSLTDTIDTSYAVTPLFSLLNHGCRPMVSRNFYKDCDTITAMCVIEEGEQIYETYGIYYHEKTKEERQEVFTKLFNFICECEACRDNWPTHPAVTDDFEEPIRTELNKIAKKLIITSRLADSFGQKHHHLPDVSKDIANIAKLILDFHSKFDKKSIEIAKLINLFSGYLRICENRFLSLT